MNQQDLNKYFSTVWQSNISQYQYSGWQLVDKIQSNETVLDVGCGFNEFKKHIPNLVGIDPANKNADIKLSIEDFRKDIKFDVAFCLGSINFGNEETIRNQIDCVVQCLKPKARIYWRCNPGRHDHDDPQCEQIDFYPWDLKKHEKFSREFGYVITEYKQDTNNRIFCEWSSKPNI